MDQFVWRGLAASVFFCGFFVIEPRRPSRLKILANFSATATQTGQINIAAPQKSASDPPKHFIVSQRTPHG